MEEEDDIDNISEEYEETTFDDDINDDEESTIILGEQKKNELIDYKESYNNYYIGTKVTKPYISKFERIKIICIRSQQLANGANPTIVVPKHIKRVETIAEMEYKEKRIPFLIRRYRPDNTYEDWRLTDFINI